MNDMKKFVIGALALIMAVTPFFGVVACSGDGEGSTEPTEQVCEHSLSRVNGTEPTCLAEGNISHYKCSLCGKTYFDEEARIELSAENIAIAKVNHTIEHYTAKGSVTEYWRCIACDNYYTDQALTQTTTYEQLYKDYYNPIKLADATGSGNMFDASSEISPLYRDFTFRCFIGWTSDAGDISQFPEEGEVQVNINLNRIGAGSRVDWYNFGVGYSKKLGLFYKPVESGDRKIASEDLSKLFVKQGGIYVIVVRQGATVSAYFEDADGNRHLFTSGSKFGAEEAVERLAANNAASAAGWVTSVTKTAICIGVADTKCIFDKAYES